MIIGHVNCFYSAHQSCKHLKKPVIFFMLYLYKLKMQQFFTHCCYPLSGTFVRVCAYVVCVSMVMWVMCESSRYPPSLPGNIRNILEKKWEQSARGWDSESCKSHDGTLNLLNVHLRWQGGMACGPTPPPPGDLRRACGSSRALLRSLTDWRQVCALTRSKTSTAQTSEQEG